MTHPQVKLDDAFWFQEGPGVRKWQFTDHGIKLLNVGNILKTGTIDLAKTDRHLSVDEVQERYSHFLADAGDLVIASSGISIDEDELLRTRGAFIEKQHLPLCMNTSTIRFKAIDGFSDLRFLKHWLQSHEFRVQITREVTGIAQKNFGPSHLKRLHLTLPPLAEQKRIAGILDAADALRAKRRESLVQLDTLLQSTFLDMFGDPVTNPMEWEMKALKHGVESFEGGRNLKPTDVERPDGVRVLKVSAVTSGEYRPWESKAFSSDEEVRTSHIVRKGDLLISRANTSALVGAVCHVWDTVGREMLPDKLWRFVWSRPRHIEPLFMLHMARSDYFREQLIQRATGTSGSMKNIGKKKMLEIPIPLPPIDLQRRFAAIVESVEQQKSTQRAHLDELDTLFASLQSRAFRGDL